MASKPLFLDGVVYQATEVCARAPVTESALGYARRTGKLCGIPLKTARTGYVLRWGYKGKELNRWISGYLTVPAVAAPKKKSQRGRKKVSGRAETAGVFCAYCELVLDDERVPVGNGEFCGYCVAEGRHQVS